MATLTANRAFDMEAFVAESSLDEFFDEAEVITQTGTLFVLRDTFEGVTETLSLSGTFGNYVGGYPTTGTVTGIEYSITDGTSFSLAEVSISVADFTDYVTSNDIAGLFAAVLADDDTLTGSSQADVLSGFAGHDTLFGNGGADVLAGDAGNDFLDGGAGGDTMAGGAGDDIYVVGQAGDTVTELANAGWDEVQTTRSSYTLTDNVEVLRFVGTGDFTGTGNGLANRIYGRDGNDTLFGRGGNDWFFVGKGEDQVNGGAGDDWLIMAVATQYGFSPATGPVSYEIEDLAPYEFLVTGADGELDVHAVAVENIELSDQRGEDVTVEVGAGSGQARIYTGAGDDSITLLRAGVADAGLGANTVVLGAGGTTAEIHVDSSEAFATVVSDPGGVATISYLDGGATVTSTVSLSGASGATLNIETGVTGNAALGIPGQGLRIDASGWTAPAGYNRLGLVDSDFDDAIIGSAHSDIFISYFSGGQEISSGDDWKIGGGGADVFDYSLAAPTDFGEHLLDVDADDVLDFSYYLTATDGGDLAFLGTGAFTGTGRELRYDKIDGRTFIEIDLDGDGDADSGVTIENGAFDLVDVGGPGAPNVLRIVATQTMVGGAGSGADTLLGGATDDVIRGLGGDDKLKGFDGNDLLDGGQGSDELTGGLGDDFYIVDHSSDRAIERAAEGTDTVISHADFRLRGAVENLTLAGTAESGIGNGLDNRLSGNAANNTLDGRSGEDTLAGGAGDDRLEGGGGRDAISGGSGDDLVVGGTQKDTLSGGGGADTFFFGAGEVGASASSADVVTDFDQAEGDRIHVRQFDADTGIGGDQNFTFIGDGAFTGVAGQLHYLHAGSNTFIEGDTDGDGDADFVIRLDGLHDLSAGDFVL